jgi:hypothetical protein
MYHPLDGVSNPKYKLFYSLTTNFFRKEKKALALNRDGCCHLALCLQLILFHYKINVWVLITALAQNASFLDDTKTLAPLFSHSKLSRRLQKYLKCLLAPILEHIQLLPDIGLTVVVSLGLDSTT